MEKHAEHNGFVGLFFNGVLFSAFAAFAVAQCSKVFTHFHTEQVWDWHWIMKSGGMPSSHTALVMGLTTAVAVEHGTSSTVFAICLVLSAIIMYDATGVRLHAGRQATVLNIIIAEMPPDHPVQDGGRLRDSLGHTPIQVAVGALVGMAVGFFVQSMYMLGRAVDGENGGAGGAGGSFASQAAAAAAAAMGSSGGGSLGPPSSA